jgi:hypothetical protein
MSPGSVILNNDIYYSVIGTDPANTIYFATQNLLTGIFSGWAPQAGSTPSSPTLVK